MKKLLDRIAGNHRDNPETPDSGYFSTMFLERNEEAPPLVPWDVRATQLQAQPLDPADGAPKFARAWRNDRHAVALADSEQKRLMEYLSFVSLAPDREVIAQDEQGAYLLIVLEGTIAVDRVQPWGGRARLGEARVGDLLGEMSLLDAGTRFSSCRTLTPCVVAVLQAHALDRMMTDDPRLAAVLLAALARRLSLRLRQASARLSALLTSST
ncbi:MAG TPA: cyclic nucleotide-binding domain-containing protein [Burkholderiaceae bacterium]|nr:cyclic nucleotide-binding domain-containing protein [Burkholderiaceae bacterium]